MNSLFLKIILAITIYLLVFFITYFVPFISPNTIELENDMQDNSHNNSEEINPLLGDSASLNEVGKEFETTSKKPDHILLCIDENYIQNTENSINESSK